MARRRLDFGGGRRVRRRRSRMSRNAAATKIQALWRGYRVRKGLAARTPARYARSKLRGRAGKVRTRYPTKGAFVSGMKVQTEQYYDNLIHVVDENILSNRTNNSCTTMFLSPLSDGDADRILINGGTLLGANIELTFRNNMAFNHQLRISVVEAVTEDKPIVSTVPLEWTDTTHFDDFWKAQTAGVKDETTVSWVNNTGPTAAAAQYAAINTDKFRVLKTKWITLGTDAGNGRAFRGVHMYVPIKRHIDKDTIVNSYTPRSPSATANNRYSYGKPVFLLIESFMPPGRTESSQQTYCYISGRIKFAMKDK